MNAQQTADYTKNIHHDEIENSVKIPNNYNETITFKELKKLESEIENDRKIKCEEINTFVCTTPHCHKNCSGDTEISKKDHSMFEENSKYWSTLSTKCYSLFNLTSNFHESFDTEDSHLGKFCSMNIEDDDSLLMRMRNYLAEFQETLGASREEHYTFTTLLRVMGQATGRCLLTVFYAILHIVPVLEILVHIIRFILDKIIDIKKTADLQQIIMKGGVFLVQLVCIYICLMFIFGFIVSPVLRMALGILAKVILVM